MAERSSGVSRDHVVAFYDRDYELVSEVAQFFADGLERGERVIVIATAAHRDALDEVLVQHGADVSRARVAGRYLAFDARETLAKFTTDSGIDAATFARVLGDIIDAAGEDGCAVRLFGEMVSLLWDADDVAGALQLEALWNDLASSRAFALMCGYRTSALTGSLANVRDVCDAHARVVPPRGYLQPDPSWTPVARTSNVFVPVPAAVPAARRFVTSVLRSWGHDAMLDDATLVISELATNAVRHAVSPFRVSLSRDEATIRIAIEDVAPEVPELRAGQADDFGSRGLPIVDKLAQRWGCDAADDGKAVWAELTAG